MFNAAVVSFGSFGFIHGILLETEPIFLLQQFRTGNIQYNDAIKPAINNLDFSGILDVLPAPPDVTGKELYHFEIIVNPQQFEPDNPEKVVFFKTMYKIPYRPDYPKAQRDDKGFTYGDDLLGVVQTIIDALGPALSTLLVPGLVNKLFPLAFKSTESTTGTIGETFSNTKFKGKAASAAIGIDSSNAGRVLEEVVKINKTNPFPGGIALRYVKGTNALLGFTHFSNHVYHRTGWVDSDLSRTFFKTVWSRLEELSISYTMHWGKLNFNLTPELLQKMYGVDRVNLWKSCRNKLLSESVREVFTNAFMVKCGLDS